MASYKVLIKPSAIRELNKIPKKELLKITDRIQTLSKDPRPTGCEKLAAQNAYRIRQGSYRIIYTIENDKLIVIIIMVGHRRDVYRKL